MTTDTNNRTNNVTKDLSKPALPNIPREENKETGNDQEKNYKLFLEEFNKALDALEEGNADVTGNAQDAIDAGNADVTGNAQDAIDAGNAQDAIDAGNADVTGNAQDAIDAAARDDRAGSNNDTERTTSTFVDRAERASAERASAERS